jgi:hypothetical protein
MSAQKDTTCGNPTHRCDATPLFAKVYMDTMHLTPSAGYKYIVQGCCSLKHWPEWEMLHNENAKSLTKFILNNIIYHWGTLLEIVTDNGAAFVNAVAYLLKTYHINHIHVSGYNSQANGLVERAHFDVRQALFKACNGDQSKWSSSAYLVFWAERVTIHRRMGCSPYFATTGTHPLLPFDIIKANYLLPSHETTLTTNCTMSYSIAETTATTGSTSQQSPFCEA